MDNRIVEEEKRITKIICKSLEFEDKVCEEAIQDILTNEFVDKEPPRFSDTEVGRTFIQDGLILAYSDGELTGEELNFIFETARSNKIERKWVEEKIEFFRGGDPDESFISNLYVHRYLKNAVENEN